MVDGVSFNPFTGKAFTAEEIELLDTDKDGVISNSELNQNMAALKMLSETDDETSLGDETSTADEGESVSSEMTDVILDDYKDTSSSYKNLTDIARVNQSGYISSSEYSDMTNATVKYLIGEFLNGNVPEEMLASINEKYTSNTYYKKAVTAVNKLKTATDPNEIMNLLKTAEDAFSSFVRSNGKEALAVSLNEFRQTTAENALKEGLEGVADALIEQSVALTNQTRGSGNEMSENEVNQFSAVVKNAIDKYVASLSEKYDDITELDVTNLANDFSLFVQNELLKMAQTQEQIASMRSDITDSAEQFTSVANAANSDKFVTAAEKEQIVEAGIDFVLSQMLNGNNDITLFSSLNKNYQTTTEYKNIESLMNEMSNLTDPDEVNAKYEELRTAIGNFLNSFDSNKLLEASKSIEPVQVSDLDTTKIISNSAIGTDYLANVSRTSSRGKQNDERLEQIQEMARADLNALAESLRTQLKAQLGDKYNEADIERYITAAINDTISQFTQNVSRRNGHGNYNTNADEAAFVFLRRSGTKKGRYTYNVQALANTFMTNFNNASSEKNAAKIDNSLATYDKENVIANSLGNDYDRNQSEKIYGKNSDKTVYAQLIEQAKSDLQSVANALKISLIEEGTGLSESEIDEIVDKCMQETIEDMDTAFQYCQPNGRVSGGRLSGMAGAAGTTAYSATAISGITGAVNAYVSSAAASGAMTAAEATSAAWAAASSSMVIPVVGLGVAAITTLGVCLSKFTNLFGATYGKHDENAGFFFERKSHSKSGNWGYDTQTLTNVFFNKVDAAIAAKKEEKKNAA